MKQLRTYRLIEEIVAGLFILLFIYTGISKLKDHYSFETVLSRSPLIGSKAVFLSWSLPIIEILVAAMLIVPGLRKYGLISSIALMSLFTGYIAYMIYYTPNLPCSCGGVLKQMTWAQHLNFNISFTLLAIAGFMIHQKNKLFVAINRNSRTPV